jgi:hypothetical protein
MPQVFSKSSNVLARVTVLAAILLLAAVVMIAGHVTPYTHNLGQALDQPAPFSHKHHVTELGIDCRYCHQSVEKSPFAGVPSTETCYTCHSQIWTNSPLLQVVRDSYAKNQPIEWNRVNNVPDFVYFDHSVHVNRGVSCYTCHGRIDQQNLTYKEHAMEMLWCLDCHRKPENGVGPADKLLDPKYDPKQHAEVGRQIVEKLKIDKKQITNCWVCHR